MIKRCLPDISIVVPAYNMQDYIDRCLQHLLDQEGVNAEIIVINDGSTDKTKEIVEKYQYLNESIKLVNQKNQGSYRSRINGALMANSEYITFCDADDYIDKNFYKSIIDLIEASKADVVQFGYRKVDEHKVLSEFGISFGEISGEQAIRLMFETTMFSTTNWNKVYRKSLFEGCDFSEIIAANDEDKLTNVKLISKARKVISVPLIGYNYVIREGSLVNAGGFSRIKILETDRIIYNYICNYYADSLKKSCGYDYCARMAYWYGICCEMKRREDARRIRKDFKTVFKENNLKLYFPVNGSIKRFIMINTVAYVPFFSTVIVWMGKKA